MLGCVILILQQFNNKRKIKQNELKVLLGTDLGFPENIVNSVTGEHDRAAYGV